MLALKNNLALKRIQKNIAYLGGDPNLVKIAGQRAGE